MYCPKCGIEIKDTNNLCTNCGSKVVWTELETTNESMGECASDSEELEVKNLESSSEKKDNFESKKKIIIGAVVATIIVLLGAIISYSAFFSPEAKYDKYLELGRKYLLEENYEEAIVAFAKAIEIDPKRVEAYEKIADAYIGLGDEEKALEYLNKGYELIKAESLRKYIDKINILIEERKLVEEQERFDDARAFLDGIAYYGDRSKCQMSAEMAAAYAEVIKRDQKASDMKIVATLADFTDTGYPILFTSTDELNEDELWDDGGDIISIVGYHSGHIVEPKFNFYGPIVLGKIADKVVVTEEQFTQDAPYALQNKYFLVEQANLNLYKEVVACDAFVESTSARGTMVEWENNQGVYYEDVSEDEIVARGFVRIYEYYSGSSEYLKAYIDGKSVKPEILLEHYDKVTKENEERDYDVLYRGLEDSLIDFYPMKELADQGYDKDFYLETSYANKMIQSLENYQKALEKEV